MNLRYLTFLGLAVSAAYVHAQQPVLFYDFSLDGANVNNLGSNTTDGLLVGGAAIGLGGPAIGFSGGPAGNILTLDGNDLSYVDTQLGRAIGDPVIPPDVLGFTTDNYTAASWVRLNSFGGDSMIFGQRDNVNVDAYLHNGIRNDNPHMGHWGNDTTGSTNLATTFGVNTWFHTTFRYRGDEQSIYLNGNLVARNFVGNLASQAKVLIGTGQNGGGLPGAVDDVAVYNSSLRANQIEFLAAGGNPNALPAPGISNQGYLGAVGSVAPAAIPQGPSVPGGSGQWAVHEVKSGDVNQPDNLVQAMNVLRNPPGGSTIQTGFTSVINRRDPEAGSSHLFANDTPFLTNTAGDDERVAFLYRAIVKVATEGDYTFGYHGDDGFALRIANHTWASFSPGDQNLAALDFDDPRTLTFPNGTGDANVRGTIHLTPGEHPIELVSWEGVGGGSHELYWAKGTFVNDADTTAWRLLGPADVQANIPSVTAAGWTVITSAPGGTELNTLNDAIADLEATGTPSNVNAINFSDPQSGNTASVPGDVPFARDTAADDDNFGVYATAKLTIDVAETYRFQFRSDDGAALRINGVTGWSIVSSAVGAVVSDRFSTPGVFDAVVADVLTGDSFTVADIFLPVGQYDIEGLFFEKGGGAFWEVMAGDADAGTLQLLAAGSNQVMDASANQLQIVPEPGAVTLLLGGFGALLGWRRTRRQR